MVFLLNKRELVGKFGQSSPDLGNCSRPFSQDVLVIYVNNSMDASKEEVSCLPNHSIVKLLTACIGDQSGLGLTR